MLDVIVLFRVVAIQASKPDRAAHPACKLRRDERPQFLELGSIDDCVEHEQALGSGRKDPSSNRGRLGNCLSRWSAPQSPVDSFTDLRPLRNAAGHHLWTLGYNLVIERTDDCVHEPAHR